MNHQYTTEQCLGICCPKHSTCQKYHAVNGAMNAPKPQGTCDIHRKTWPGYIELVEVK